MGKSTINGPFSIAILYSLPERSRGFRWMMEKYGVFLLFGYPVFSSWEAFHWPFTGCWNLRRIHHKHRQGWLGGTWVGGIFSREIILRYFEISQNTIFVGIIFRDTQCQCYLLGSCSTGVPTMPHKWDASCGKNQWSTTSTISLVVISVSKSGSDPFKLNIAYFGKVTQQWYP